MKKGCRGFFCICFFNTFVHMKYRISYYLLFLLLTAPFLLCAQTWKKEVAKMTKVEKPFFYYKDFTQNPTTKAKTGDQLRIQYTIATYGKKTQILISSYDQAEPVLVQLPAERYDNYFTAPLRKMAIGDSIKVIIPFDSISNSIGEIAQFFKKKEAVVFTYKLLDIVSAETLQKEQQAAEQKADSLRNFMKEQILFFEKGDMANQFLSDEQGLQYKIFKQGNSDKKAQFAKTVQVHYLCFDKQGNLLDDSYASGQTISLTQAQNNYIKGIEKAIRLLNENATAMVIIPPHLAYGENGIAGLIPPNSTLIFWLEVLTVNL